MDSFAASLSASLPIAKQTFTLQANGSLGYIVPSPMGICVHIASSFLVKQKQKQKPPQKHKLTLCHFYVLNVTKGREGA